jgi:hypothetical protein
MLLPNPEKYNPNPPTSVNTDGTLFFENPIYDTFAKQYIGNHPK